MLALTLVGLTALHAGPEEAARLSPDAAAIFHRAESRRDWALPFKGLAALGAIGVIGSGGTAVAFGVKALINFSGYNLSQGWADEANRNFALAACAASAGLVLVSGLIAWAFDAWAEKLTRDAASTAWSPP